MVVYTTMKTDNTNGYTLESNSRGVLTPINAVKLMLQIYFNNAVRIIMSVMKLFKRFSNNRSISGGLT